MRTNVLLSVLFCAACQTSTQTFLVSQLTIPERQEDFGRDIDLDGVIDNEMFSWSTIWRSFGVSTQENLDILTQSGAFNIGLDLIDRGVDVELIGYQTYSNPGQGFLFDGGDVLQEAGGLFWFDDASLTSVEGSAPKLAANTQQFVWGMLLFDELFLLPLESVEVTGALQDDKIVDGSITGFIQVEEVAKIILELPEVLASLTLREAIAFNAGGAPIGCEGDPDGSAAVCESISSSSFCTDRAADGFLTGVCVSIDSKTRTFAEGFDGDRDGHYTVIRDPETGAFIENELFVIFDLDGFGEAPEGIVGGFFKLDFNNDEIPEAMGVGVGFEAVSATKKSQ
jgi:hypothetical protein